MGLDIYLCSAIDAAQNKAYYEASNALYERPDYESLSEAERKAIRDAMPPYAPHVDVRSERYPEHLFSRSYLRSSYSSGGFNHAVPEMLGTSAGSYPHERGSLYWIFEPMGREWDGDEGDLTHDDIDKLRECKDRALTIAEELAKCDRLRVMTVSPNIFGHPPHTDDQALAMYRAELPLREDCRWHSKGPDLNVYGEGLTVLAAIPGKGPLGSAGVHLIYRAADDGFDSYVQSAEIVAEFCDEAIALIERDGGASMSWSG